MAADEDNRVGASGAHEESLELGTVERHVSPASITFRRTPLDHGRTLQDIEMMREKVPRHVERYPELTHSQVAGGKKIHHGQARFITEGPMHSDSLDQVH